MSENNEEKVEVMEKKVQLKSKVDPELRARISRMEKEKRDAMSKFVPKAEQKKVKPIAGISFKLWWVEASKKLDLKPYLKEIVWADFKARGLCEREPKEKYDQAMRLFGYKL